MIPKPDGGERARGIATIRDRVVQTAAKLVLEPIFEADFEDNAYGYRPARGAVDAVKEEPRLICRGYTDVVDADLSRYFDTIPHRELLHSVARRVADGSVLRLIRLWLKAPIEEREADGTRRMSGGKSRSRGTPQGGVAEPAAGQHRHEPVPEALAADRTRRSVPSPRGLVCRRRAPYHLALDPFRRKEGFGRNDPWANGLPGGESQRGQ
jgi:hypothetical protein